MISMNIHNTKRVRAATRHYHADQHGGPFETTDIVVTDGDGRSVTIYVFTRDPEAADALADAINGVEWGE